MDSKKGRKAKLLPKYGTLNRTKMVQMIFELPSYKECLEKGYPFFTNGELEIVEKKYQEVKGLTWDEIETELASKGIFLKKVTFRKYIQDGYLPQAITYRNTEKGRMAVFPLDVILHINFIQYFYKVATHQTIDQLFSIINDSRITYAEAIESHFGPAGIFSDLPSAIHDYVVYDDGSIYNAVTKTLSNKKSDQQKIMKMLDEIHEAYLSIEAEIKNLVKFLEQGTMFVREIPPDETAEDKE